MLLEPEPPVGALLEPEPPVGALLEPFVPEPPGVEPPVPASVPSREADFEDELVRESVR